MVKVPTQLWRCVFFQSLHCVPGGLHLVVRSRVAEVKNYFSARHLSLLSTTPPSDPYLLFSPVNGDLQNFKLTFSSFQVQVYFVGKK